MAVRGSAIILPCIFTVLSPLNHLLFFKMDMCLGHIIQKGLKLNLVHT